MYIWNKKQRKVVKYYYKYSPTIRHMGYRSSGLQAKQPLPWLQDSTLRSIAADHQDWRVWDQYKKGGWVGGWPKRRRHRRVALRHGLGRATARDWRCPGLSSAHKKVPRRRKNTRIDQETGQQRSGWRVITPEEERKPGTGGTTPLGTGRYRNAGRGRQVGRVGWGMAEEGRHLEWKTHRGYQECYRRWGQRKGGERMGKKQMKRARNAGLQGATWIWGVGWGQQYSGCRDRQ